MYYIYDKYKAMSHHVLHIFQHGAFLTKDRGMLVCQPPKDSGKPIRKMPLEDIRAVIIAARGVSLSCPAIGALLEQEAIILHCNERYEPCGMTAPLVRIIEPKTFLSQSAMPTRLNGWIWDKILQAKTANQLAVLQLQGLDCAQLRQALKGKHIVEGHCARQYWLRFFPSIGWKGLGRDQKNTSPPNRFLNYGYTVLSTLCHRALLVHGLNPLLGVGHRARYRSAPLVYDLMEPYRLFVDRMLIDFLADTKDPTEELWARFVGACLKSERVHHERYTLKLLDAVEKSASTLAKVYLTGTVAPLWLPQIPQAQPSAPLAA